MRSGLKACQCGAVPQYHVVRPVAKGRRRRPSRERLVCPLCGNMTSARRSRQRLVQEWALTGWCGMSEVRV